MHSNWTKPRGPLNADQLIGYSGPDHSSGTGGSVTDAYAYDAAGLRQTKTTASSLANEAYDLSGDRPLLIEDGPTAYITGPGNLPIEQITQTGITRYYSHDHQGSTTALTSSTGSTVSTQSYDGYGNPTNTPAISQPFGYTGQPTDSETGLQYLQARYYDPSTGQFLTVDPLAASTRRPYVYANDNPANNNDPTGQSALPGVAVGADTACAGTALVPGLDAVTCGGAALATIGAVFAEATGSEDSDLPWWDTAAASETSTEEGCTTSAGSGARPSGPPGPDFEWRGPADKGAWYNPKTGEYWRPDPNHGGQQGPHWDYRDSEGTRWRVYRDGRFERKG